MHRSKMRPRITWPNARRSMRRACRRADRTRIGRSAARRSRSTARRASSWVRCASDVRRMQYARMKSKRLPIGSGVMEASCKTLVAQRMKLSGQRWSVPGAQAVLTARGWDQSDRFDEAFALLAATYEHEVTIFTPLRGALAASELDPHRLALALGLELA